MLATIFRMDLKNSQSLKDQAMEETRWAKRMADGLCLECNEPSVDGYRCEKHKQINIDRGKAKYAEFAAACICVKCRVRPATGINRTTGKPLTTCDECREKKNEDEKKRREKKKKEH